MSLMRRPHKYGARKVHIAGEAYDSAGEAKWIAGLRLREKAGEISEVERQVKFDLEVNGLRVCSVILDASWLEDETRQYGDYKGMLTRDARLKYKLFEAIYGRPVRVFSTKGEVKQNRVRARRKPRASVKQTIKAMEIAA